MTKKPANIPADSTPHASLGNHEADHAGAFFSELKNPQTVEQLAEHLIDKGLAVSSIEDLIYAIERHGYYRLRGHWITLEQDGHFKPGASLKDILEIESFNRELTDFLFAQISTVEIYLRSQLSTVLAQHYGAAALHREEAFDSQVRYRALQNSLERETYQAKRSKKPFVTHNLDKYGQLPIWAEVENSTLGTLSKAYGNLASAEVSSEVAKRFGIPRSYLKSWLSYLTQIRNSCAHCDRLYNRLFCTLPKMFREFSNIEVTRLFPVFIVLFKLYDSIDPERTNLLRGQLGRIVDAHPTVDLKPVGFPDNWREVLRIPDPGTRDLVRPRGRQGGRPLKNAAVIEQALYQYDMREDSVAEIAKRCGLSLSTLYKYIHQREETGSYSYQAVSLEAE